MSTNALIVLLTLSASLAGWLQTAAGQTIGRSASLREGAVLVKDETSSLPAEGGSRPDAQLQTALSRTEHEPNTGVQNGNSLGSSPVAASSGIVGLANPFLDAQWTLDVGRIAALTLTNMHSKQILRLKTGYLPSIVLDDGRIISLAALTLGKPVHRKNNTLFAYFQDDASGLDIRWSAELGNAANYITQSLQLTAGQDTKIRELIFVDTPIDGARQVGQVDGSVVVCGDVFLAVEHPLAKNTADKNSHVRCSLPRGNVLMAGQTWRYTSVFGVVEPGQLRRGFLTYLERRRAHPYRPFLHYNSWYHLNIGRPDNHMTEAECLATIEHFGRELIEKRGVIMDAFVWDDGWDDFNSLWGFHRDFPNGFRNLQEAGVAYGAAQGVWMSPWGGYGEPKQKRIAYGKSQGYETNAKGFSMAGPKYRTAFREVCQKMIRDQGVVFFKFDGMGGAGGTGAAGELADDVDAVLRLASRLREQAPNLFISATVGTWASPFWTLYADSVWRQGGDTGFHGSGNGRQQWITYRDMYCYRCIVQWGPLYPLNSLMLHGPCIGERTNPAKMDRDEKSVADEIWTFFGSGTNLQELYISPHLLTPTMWDELAAAAKWSRGNTDVLVDTHWIGGDPGAGAVYGWASWQPHGGIVVLRNPSDKPGTYELELARDLELPSPHLTDYVLNSPRPAQRIDSLRAASVEPLRIELEPFEVLVFETAVVPGATKYSAEAYRQRSAERETARTNAALVLDPNQGPTDAASPINPAELQKLRDARWSEEKAWAWYAEVGPIAGCNYLPRTAVNMTEMWQKETFDPKTIAEELGWAEEAGYNNLRVFVQYLVWKDDPEGLKRRIDEFLTIADRHGMRVMLLPFCDCAFAGREPYLGQQDDPVPGVHNSGWVPSPGLKRVVDRAVWPDLERYIKDLVGRFGNDRRVLIWDLYNEPGNSRMGEKSLPLATAAFRWAREAKPAQPLTIGAWTDFDSRMSKALMEMSDVVSFHGYDAPAGVVGKSQICRAYNRPVLCTEWLHRQSGNTFETILPVFAQNRIGGYHWGLAAGRTQTYMPWGSKQGDTMPNVWQHDAFHSDGTPYDAREFELLRQYCEDFQRK